MPDAKPQRIQLSRLKGFNLQNRSLELNGLPCVKVDRSTKWGNPFRVDEYGAAALDLYRSFVPSADALVIAARKELRGKNLACWCSQESACHAAILLLVANSDGDVAEAIA